MPLTPFLRPRTERELSALGTPFTATPASSNSEETHNTLKFAHRSKHIEIKSFPKQGDKQSVCNPYCSVLVTSVDGFSFQIIDEKSLIKKYQKEISSLKEELQQLRRGIMGNGGILPTDQEDLVNLKLQVHYTSYTTVG